MRLINTETGKFEEFFDLSTTPPYAILSHTWDRTGEQTYQDVIKIQEKYKPVRHHVSFQRRYAALLSENTKPRSPFQPPPEAPTTTPSHSPLCMAQESRCPRCIFAKRLRMPRWTHIFSKIRLGAWLSRSLGPATKAPSNIHTPLVPPITHRSIWDSDSGLSEKVRRACQLARLDGYHYIWVDSCCIDKTSSSELSESINSMFNWYQAAQVCYAFLADTPSDEDVRAESSMFRRSRWFTRCWTLQELIAPLVVVFLSKDWEGLGTKDMLADVIQEITSIDRGILTHERALNDESVADRMQWAANREATRVEDEAYSLLGIFGITMYALYGEGRYAFRRLQEQILDRIPDQSLFTWGRQCMSFPMTATTISVDPKDSQTPLAPSPHVFESQGYPRIIQATGDSFESLELPVENYTQTPFGICTTLCLLPLRAVNPELQIENKEGDSVPWYIVVLGCQYAGDEQRLLSRLCCLRRGKADIEFLFLADWIQPDGSRGDAYIFTLSLEDLARIRTTHGRMPTKTVYLPHLKSSVTERRLGRMHDADTLNLTLPPWAPAALRMAAGYDLSIVQLRPTEDDPNPFSLSLRPIHASFNICIHYRRMEIYPPRSPPFIILQARLWILSSATSNLRNPQTNFDDIMERFPPYTSATWVDRVPWAMTLPARRLNLVTDSREEVTLRLGPYLAVPSQYGIRIEVAPTSPGPAGMDTTSPRPVLKDLPNILNNPHKTFNLIMTGSARKALETKGYSAHLALEQSLDRFHSHSLTLFCNADSFAIVVKFLFTLGRSALETSQRLIVMARVTLELLNTNDDPDAVCYDGPHTVLWSDSGNPASWNWSLEDNCVVLATPTGKSLVLHLGLDLAWQSEYYLHVDIEPCSSPLQSPACLPSLEEDSPWSSLTLAHQSIHLSLPGHVRRALRGQGYEVRFEGPGLDSGGESGGDPVRHLLTLSHISAGITIAIEYSHHLITHYPKLNSGLSTSQLEENYPFLLADPQPDSSLPTPTAEASFKRCQQELSFQASVRTLFSGSIRSDTRVASQGDVTTSSLVWDAKHKRLPGGWRRHFPRKDITLTLPTGHQLMLRLGFYFVWYSEYCLMVDIDPQTPLSHYNRRSRDSSPGSS